jgi:hypothetical protein
MRQSTIFFVVGIMVAGLAWYMTSQVVNPLNEAKINELVALHGFTKPEELYAELNNLVVLGVIQEYINLQQVAVVSLLVIFSIMSFFIAAHTFLDKLFFKEFYRKPNLRLAVRRAVLLGIAIGGGLALRLLGLSIWACLAPLLLAFTLELLFVSILRARKPRDPAPDLPPDDIIEPSTDLIETQIEEEEENVE